MKIKDITKEDIIAWLAERDQAWEDFCEYFEVDHYLPDDEPLTDLLKKETVYHVYESFYDEPWYPAEETAKIFSSFEDACKYGNELIKDALDNGEELDTAYDNNSEFNENCLAVFFGDGFEDDHRIYIDEYEVS